MGGGGAAGDLLIGYMNTMKLLEIVKNLYKDVRQGSQFCTNQILIDDVY